jgi:hypothetical protein
MVLFQATDLEGLRASVMDDGKKWKRWCLNVEASKPTSMMGDLTMNAASNVKAIAPELGLSRAESAASGKARKAALAAHASGRRRFVDPATCDRDYSTAEVEFLRAMEEYKKSSGRMFPTWSEVLEVLGSLGYRKPVQIPISNLQP